MEWTIAAQALCETWQGLSGLVRFIPKEDEVKQSRGCQCRALSLHAGLERGSQEYERLKEERSQVLWRAVEKVIPDIRQRTEVELVGWSASLTCALHGSGME